MVKSMLFSLHFCFIMNVGQLYLQLLVSLQYAEWYSNTLKRGLLMMDQILMQMEYQVLLLLYGLHVSQRVGKENKKQFSTYGIALITLTMHKMKEAKNLNFIVFTMKILIHQKRDPKSQRKIYKDVCSLLLISS